VVGYEGSDAWNQLLRHVLLPEPGAPNFWQSYMLEWAEHGNAAGADHVFTLQLRPRQTNGYEGTYALGRPTSHGKLRWNEQGAIVISVRGLLAFEHIRT
jgi:hypothetical protein